MKKILIPLLALFLVGCSQVKEIEDNNKEVELQDPVEQKIVFDETEYTLTKYEQEAEEKGDITGPRELELAYMETMNLYNNIDKEDLKYAHDNNLEEYTFESEIGLAFASSLQDTKPINDKKYKEILQAFSFPSEINPINQTYDEVSKLIDKVLPDGYEKVDEKKYTEDASMTTIHYTSEKGNFMVALQHGFKENEDGAIVLDEKTIAGITYYIEI